MSLTLLFHTRKVFFQLHEVIALDAGGIGLLDIKFRDLVNSVSRSGQFHYQSGQLGYQGCHSVGEQQVGRQNR